MAGDDAWHVYLARCADGSLYCGVARDVAARIARHNAGTGARYTRGRRPVVLAWTQPCGSRGDALRREREVKAMTRRGKLTLMGA